MVRRAPSWTTPIVDTRTYPISTFDTLVRHKHNTKSFLFTTACFSRVISVAPTVEQPHSATKHDLRALTLSIRDGITLILREIAFFFLHLETRPTWHLITRPQRATALQSQAEHPVFDSLILLAHLKIANLPQPEHHSTIIVPHPKRVTDTIP